MFTFFTESISHGSPTFARPKRVNGTIYSSRINTFDNERYRGVGPSSLSASCDNSNQIFWRHLLWFLKNKQLQSVTTKAVSTLISFISMRKCIITVFKFSGTMGLMFHNYTLVNGRNTLSSCLADMYTLFKTEALDRKPYSYICLAAHKHLRQTRQYPILPKS